MVQLGGRMLLQIAGIYKPITLTLLLQLPCGSKKSTCRAFIPRISSWISRYTILIVKIFETLQIMDLLQRELGPSNSCLIALWLLGEKGSWQGEASTGLTSISRWPSRTFTCVSGRLIPPHQRRRSKMQNPSVKVVGSITNLRIITTIIGWANVSVYCWSVLRFPSAGVLPEHLQVWPLPIVLLRTISALLLMIHSQSSVRQLCASLRAFFPGQEWFANVYQTTYFLGNECMERKLQQLKNNTIYYIKGGTPAQSGRTA